MRQAPKQEFNRMGFAGYCFFLTIFFVVATNRRDSDVYNFGQSVREIVQAQWFERIGGDTDYYEYLGLHFFPGLKDNSFERPDAKPFSLVGAPRIRAVRASSASSGAAARSIRAIWPRRPGWRPPATAAAARCRCIEHGDRRLAKCARIAERNC